MLAQARDPVVGKPWVAHYPTDVPTHIEYPAEPVYWLLEEAVRKVPNRVACRHRRDSLTYAELLARSRRMASALRARGLKPGDRVALLMPNMPEYLVSLFGTWMAGGAVVPLNPLMVAEEVVALLKATDCRFVVALDVLLPLLGRDGEVRPEVVFVTTLKHRLPLWDRFLYKLVRWHRLGLFARFVPKQAVDMNDALQSAPTDFEPHRALPTDIANILPTGGTTGRPKAVVLTHRNLFANAWQVWHWNGCKFGEDVLLACLPFFHSYGMTTCALNGVASGATLVLQHRFRAEAVLRLIEKTKPTLVPAVPAMLAAFNKVLAKRHYDMTSIRGVISGGGPLPPTVAAEFSSRSGAVVVEGYGLSEASPVTHAGPLDGSARSGTIGLPFPDTEAMIVDAETGKEVLPTGQVGELIIRGPQVMAGYWNDAEATSAALRDGWLFTGDLASHDEDGFFKIVDRKKDLIITSGVNVYPTDVEHVLRKFEGVDDVGVIGIPDPVRGELVKAIVVPKAGQKFNRKAFDAFAREHLEAHKRPRVVDVVRGPLPRNQLGKLLRRLLREMKGGEAIDHPEEPAKAG